MLKKNLKHLEEETETEITFKASDYHVLGTKKNIEKLFFKICNVFILFVS